MMVYLSARLAVCIFSVLWLTACEKTVAQKTESNAAPITILPGDSRLDLPDFNPYEAEYGSAFGRFTNQVRLYKGDSGQKISVLNLIETPSMVIVDHRGIDAKSLRMEYFYSPYFAWGPEYVVGQSDAQSYTWVRVPADGAEPLTITGALEHNGYFDGLGFSPTLAAMMPMDIGVKFRIPKDQPRKAGHIVTELVEYEVLRKESLKFESGLRCNCWVLEERPEDGSIHLYWIDRKAPFLFRRHRDVGGSRDFVSDVISFRPL